MTDSARTEEIRARVDFDNANEVAIAAASAIERETGYINLEGVMLHDAAMVIEEYAEQRVKKAVTALREEVERLKDVQAKQREAEEKRADMFWPPKDDVEKMLYEIRNGKVPAYVRECADALVEQLAALKAGKEGQQ